MAASHDPGDSSEARDDLSASALAAWAVAAGQEVPRRVGLFLISKDYSYQKLLARDAERAARRHGVALEVVYSGGSAAQQAQDIVRFVHAHPHCQLGVVVMTVSDSQPATEAQGWDEPVYRLARRVAARGAAWVILNRQADDQVRALRQEFPSLPIALVTPEQKELGRIQGSQFKALLPRGGRVLYVLGAPQVSSTQDRRAGMLEALAGSSIHVDEVDGLWSQDRAREAVYRWLVAPNRRREDWPQVVGCQNDEMALGAWQALCRAAVELGAPGLREVRVTGIDGLADRGQLWVAEGKLAATVVVPSTSGPAIDMLVRAWSSGGPVPSKTVEWPTSQPDLAALAASACPPAASGTRG